MSDRASRASPQRLFRAAAILCGGASRRMGRDKCALRLGATTMLEAVVAGVEPAVDAIVLVGRAPDQLPARLWTSTRGVRRVALQDRQPGLGPLEGIRRACEYLAQERASFALLAVGCDTPLIGGPLVELLFSLIDPAAPSIAATQPVAQPAVAAQAAAVRRAGEWLPLPGAYRESAGPLAERLLAAGHRSVQRLLDALPTHAVEGDALRRADPTGALRNINDPQDYAEICRDWARADADASGTGQNTGDEPQKDGS